MKVPCERVGPDLVQPSRLPVGHDLALEETVGTVAGAAIARKGWAKEFQTGIYIRTWCQILSPCPPQLRVTYFLVTVHKMTLTCMYKYIDTRYSQVRHIICLTAIEKSSR